jgi:hypothetical protein
MRPASEIHSSLEMIERDLPNHANDPAVAQNLTIVRDVLRWVMGSHWVDLSDGDHPWLVAYLLDDPPRLDDTPTESN